MKLPFYSTGAHLILVTRGDNDTLNLTDEKTIKKFAVDYQLKFSSILVPKGQTGTGAKSFYDALSKFSNGRSFQFQLPNSESIHDDCPCENAS